MKNRIADYAETLGLEEYTITGNICPNPECDDCFGVAKTQLEKQADDARIDRESSLIDREMNRAKEAA